MMSKVILYYLYGILIVPILLRMTMGNLAGVAFHPGLMIHGGVLIMLFVEFVLIGSKSPNNMKYLKFMFVGFSIVYAINLLLVESIQFSGQPLGSSIEYSLKIFMFILLSNYIYRNGEYFGKKLNSILLVNSIVLLTNVIAGYYLQVGWQSYQRSLEDSYRGFLAGNDTSIFSFIVFGYALYAMRNMNSIVNIIKYVILLVMSLFSMYIIGTKAIIVAGFIFMLFSLQREKSITNHNRIQKYGPILLGFVIIFVILYSPEYQERYFKNYFLQIAKNDALVTDLGLGSALLSVLGRIAPGRIIIGSMMLIQQLSGSLINILFGYGVSGIYQAFGRPPMASVFSIFGYFGIFGFSMFYIPQLLHALSVWRGRNYNLVQTMFLSIFIYGSLGGFVYGVSNTSNIFSLFFGLSMYNHYRLAKSNS